MVRPHPLLLCICLGAAAAARSQDPVVLPAGLDADAAAEAAAAVRPSSRQLAWQQLGFLAFVHFGMDTFTDREWGEGTEDPAAFAPSDLDADQWAATFAAAGMKGVVLTCKHHDGFCLWPTASTAHSVKASPWREGRGDVVAEVAAACRGHGLQFGVYLSPWDRNCKAFGTAAYQSVFLTQLRELCSGYGPLSEVWFDGAHCPADEPGVFDWQQCFQLVRELQPAAVIAITGPDVRWVGNEAGATREQEWSVLPLDDADPGGFEDSRAAWRSLWRLRERNQEPDLGSRARLAGARRLCWWPAETDVSIRPGWFWHPAEDAQVKPLPQLLDSRDGAAGGNAVLLLNVPPDRRGRIADPDAAVLQDLGAVLEATFADDLADGALRKQYARAGELYLPQPRTIDVIDLREDLAAAGQRVERFRIDTWDGQQWKELVSGGTIGCRRLLRIEPVEVQGCRYWIEQSRGRVRIAHFSLHKQPDLLAPPRIARAADGKVTITAPGGIVRYTTDGRPAGAESAEYKEPFALPRGGSVHAVALPREGARTVRLRTGSSATATFGIVPADWRVLECSSEQAPREAAALAFDGDPKTHWHSRWSPDSPGPPHSLAIDLGAPRTVTGFAYLPREDGSNGTIADYEFDVRGESGDWRTVARGTFAHAGGLHAQSVVRLPEPAAGVRAVRFVARREVEGRAWASCAELAVLVD